MGMVARPRDIADVDTARDVYPHRLWVAIVNRALVSRKVQKETPLSVKMINNDTFCASTAAIWWGRGIPALGVAFKGMEIFTFKSFPRLRVPC